MIKVSYDAAPSVVLIEFIGTVTPADGEQFFVDVEHVLPKCGKSFSLLTDTTNLEKIEPDTKNVIARSMDLFNSHGVKKVVRVIPDPSKDIGFNILSIFHYGKDVKIITVDTLEEARAKLKQAPEVRPAAQAVNEKVLSTITVYYGSPSIYGRKVLTVLKEKDLDFEIKPVKFAEKEHLSETYLKLNPNGEVPVLDDDGRIIYESTAIIEYLDEEYPEPPLMPQDPFERAQVRMIEDFCDLHLYPEIRKCAIKFRKKEPITEEDRQAVRAQLDRIEAYLGNQKFLAGEFSLADCAFMPVIPSLSRLGMEDLLEKSEHFKAYIKKLRARRGFEGAGSF